MRTLCCAVVASLIGLAGCGAPQAPSADEPTRGVWRDPKAPVPPEPPRRRDVPIDTSLRQRAEAEIDKAFASDDAFLRANAIEATQKTPSDDGVRRIEAALRDPSPVVRYAGAMAAGTMRLSHLRPQVQTMIDDPNDKVQVGVRFALHRLGDTTHSHDLEKFARSPDPSVRRTTAMVLGLLENKSAFNILRYLENDDDATVRLQVVESAYRLGDADAKESLAAATLSRYADDQIFALLAFGTRMDEGVVPLLRGKLTADYPEVALTAARSLGMLGSDLGMGVALESVDAKEPRQRALAALALGDIRRPDAQPQLKKLLDDKSPAVRIAAATAILQLKP